MLSVLKLRVPTLSFLRCGLRILWLGSFHIFMFVTARNINMFGSYLLISISENKIPLKIGVALDEVHSGLVVEYMAPAEEGELSVKRGYVGSLDELVEDERSPRGRGDVNSPRSSVSGSPRGSSRSGSPRTGSPSGSPRGSSPSGSPRSHNMSNAGTPFASARK